MEGAAAMLAEERSAVASVAFLLRMADNFAMDSNLPESVKSAETALLLRKSHAEAVQRALERQAHTSGGGSSNGIPAEDFEVIPATLDLHAKNLVLQCNSYAVTEFTHSRFDTAIFFLNKALFLTEVNASAAGYLRAYAAQMRRERHCQTGAEDEAGVAFMHDIQARLDEQQQQQEQLSTSNNSGTLSFCFSAAAEEDRLRLRAATYNNLGCLERRRGCHEDALQFLRKAIQVESELDPTGASGGTATASASSSTPSIYLNLCTVLNELGRHGEAVVAAQSAVAACQQSLGEQADTDGRARAAMMLMVGQYNLGVSLERRGAKDSKAEEKTEVKGRRAKDAEAAQRAYQQSLDMGRRYRLVAADCPTIDAAVEAVKRNREEEEAVTLISQIAPTPPQPQPHPPQQQQREVYPHSSETPSYSRSNATDTHVAPHTAPVEVSQAVVEERTEEVVAVVETTTEKEDELHWASAGAAAAAHNKAPRGSNGQDKNRGNGDASTDADPDAVRPTSASSEPDFARQGPPRDMSGEELDRAPVGATWHPSRCTPLAPSLPPPRPASKGRSGGGGSGSLHSHPSAASLLFAPTPVAARISAGGTPINHSNHNSPINSNGSHNGSGVPGLLRPPRPPQSGRPPLPPTLAPLRQQQQQPRSPARAAVGATPLVDRGSASSPSTSIAGSGHLPSPGGGTLHNPFGRRMFGSSSVHQKRTSIVPGLTTSGSGSVSAAVLAAAVASGSGSASGHTTTRSGAGGSRGSASSLLQRQRAVRKEQRTVTRAERQQRRAQQQEQASDDAALANDLYEQLVEGMAREDLLRCRAAATAIQRVWRGVAARTWLRTMIAAAMRLQLATRRFLVKVRSARLLAEAEAARQRAAQERREREACGVIQARARVFLRRLQIRREFIARQRRGFFAARAIQRGYRGYRSRRAALVAAQAEAHRQEDERRAFSRRAAARRVQAAWRRYQQRKAEIAAAAEQQRRARAAAKIQGLVRGVITRAWFRYYRDYRHGQEMRSAASQRRLTTVQTFCRSLLAARDCHRRRLALMEAARVRRLNVAATRLQCMWRRHVAGIRLERLRAERAREDRLATVVQRWYRSRRARVEFLAHLAAKQRWRAATLMQRWLRERWAQRKARDFAAYHAEKLREQRLVRLKLWAAPVVQACARARDSALLVESMRASHVKNVTAGLLWQRTARGYAGRQAVAFTLEMTRRVAQRDREVAVETRAARVLQRAWRIAAAKSAVEHRRREVAATAVIAYAYRQHRAREELRRLRAARRAAVEAAAASRIQEAYRGHRAALIALDMKARYEASHKKKIWLARRGKAAVQVQALWKGHVTRRALVAVRAEHRREVAAALVIQRGWRGIAQRDSLRAALVERAGLRNVKVTAALTIQCFWRKMTAAERVAGLRVLGTRRLAAAVRLQSWWRCVDAWGQLRALAAAQVEREALAALYAARWEGAATLVCSFLRCRQSAEAGLDRRRDGLLSQLADEERVAFHLRRRAVLRLQRVFRGHLARAALRDVLLERVEAARAAADRLAAEEHAALRVQGCYRRHAALLELRRRRVAHREAILSRRRSSADGGGGGGADPGQIVRELFWARDLAAERDSTAERLARAKVHDRAAVAIQRCFRRHRARTAAAGAASRVRATQAVRTITQHFARHRASRAIHDAHSREAAAVRLQAAVRGWLMRRRWAAWRDAVAAERAEHTAIETVLDVAATRIQSGWRGVTARRQTQALRERRAEEKAAQARDEAAAMIQTAYRTHLDGSALLHDGHDDGGRNVHRTY